MIEASKGDIISLLSFAQAIIETFGDQAFIDTAEVYGPGLSEEYLGLFIRANGLPSPSLI